MIVIISISIKSLIYISGTYDDGVNDEAAFANYHLLYSIGLIIAFILPQFVCMADLMTILIVAIALGWVCGYILRLLVFKTIESSVKHGLVNQRSVGSSYDNIYYEYLLAYRLIHNVYIEHLIIQHTIYILVRTGRQRPNWASKGQFYENSV